MLFAAPAMAAGPIDVCKIVTPAEAAAVLGPLPQQPPAATDNAGFGMYTCMYIGPAVSGQGAQTKFLRLTVEAGSSKDAADMTQTDADKRKATTALSGVGDAAKRNAAGTFVWAKKGAAYCTAEIANGLPKAQTADSVAAKLGALCQKVLAAAK
jgi:hypothetical protein